MNAPRPSILWIVTTQWRGQTAGFAGDADARTPALDAFARGGVVFDRAFSNHPFGPFARALLLTGRLSPANGVVDYWDPLPRQQVTVARQLAAAGYTTAFFGKWHLAPRESAAPVVGEAHARQVVGPEDRGGFGFWEGFEGGFQLNNPWLHGTRLPEPKQFSGYQSDLICARAADWLRAGAASGAPCFCVVSLEPPHPPYEAPVPEGIPERDPASLRLAPNVPGGATAQTARRELAGYHRHIEATDRAIGRLAAAVDPATTAVFISSTHGDMHGAHGLFRKGWPFEESVRVPLLGRWPGAVPARVRTPVSLADLPATALALAGLPFPREAGAADLRALPADADRTVLLGMPSAPPFEKQCPHPWRAVRTRDFLFAAGADGLPWLLFDLAADPWEERNLAADPAAAGLRRRIAGILAQALQTAGDPFRLAID